MDEGRKLLLIGDGEFAEIAYEYFMNDSPHEVIGFSAERAFMTKGELFGLPVVPFEEVEDTFRPDQHDVFVAVTYTQLNRLRTRLLAEARRKGYRPVSYVSSRAFVWPNAQVGENCFVFENNVVQYHVRLGDNVVLWSGNHIGHRTSIGDNCFLSSHVVVSGYCEIGESCFFGVNSAVADKARVGGDCVVGMGAVVTGDLEPGGVYVGNPARRLEKSSRDAFHVPAGSR